VGVSYSSPLLSRAGAAEHQGATFIDAAGVAWHYGDPLVEQRAAHNGTAIVDRSQRRVIAVAGPDAGEFLNNLLSQKLDTVPQGFSAGALDFDIKGHILHQMDLTLHEGTFYLDVPTGQFDSLLDYLTKMIFWSKVTVEEADLALITLLGPQKNDELPIPATAVFSREVDWLGIPRSDIAVPRASLVDAVSELEEAGGRLVGLMAYTAERVRACEPELAADLDNKAIAHEVPQWIARGQSPAFVHLEKGCYRGQETVARVENLGRSPRVLVLLNLDGSAPSLPAIGDPVELGTRQVGRVGTIVQDFEWGPIALALVKRSALSNPQLHIGDVAASLDPDSVPSDEGPKAGRAAVDRLRGR